MAHAHATHALDGHLAAALARPLAQGVKQLIAAFGHAAGTKADVDLSEAVAGRRFHFLGGLRPRRRCLAGEIVADLVGRILGGGVSYRRVAHLHHGRERATTEAGDLFDGELLRRVGVGARRNVQVPSQRLLHFLGSRDVAGGAAADPENMFARRLVAKHIVKGRNPGDGGGLNVGQLDETLQRLLGQVAMMFLERL